MTTPLKPPAKKNPLLKTVSPTQPPAFRSRAAIGLMAAAAEGRFMLQVCAACRGIQYPPRDACSDCLSTDLNWQDIPPQGQLLAETSVQTSTNLYFRERTPWRTGSVKLDAGPVIICHVHGDVEPRARVTMRNLIDRSGQGVLLAVSEERSPAMEDDPQLRAMSSDPKHRRVLITDGRNPNTPAIAEALKKAGASMVFVGEAETWLPNPIRRALQDMPDVHVVSLDVTDSRNVRELAGEIGGKVDILINNARFMRPGGPMDRSDTAFAQQEMEVNYFGLMRLAQAFGPGMCARTADAVNSAVAWVNILSAHALSNDPSFGCFNASHAAALSLSQSLRGAFRTSGLRLMTVFVGPTEDEWYQEVPPPKVQPRAVATSIVQGLQGGLEDVYCGDVAQELIERFRAGPKVLERELTSGG